MISNKKGHKFIIRLEDEQEKTLHLTNDQFWAIYAGYKIEAIDILAKEIDENKIPLLNKRILRTVRKEVNRRVDEYKKGELIHLSKLNDYAWLEYLKEQGMSEFTKQKGNTYVKQEESN